MVTQNECIWKWHRHTVTVSGSHCVDMWSDSICAGVCKKDMEWDQEEGGDSGELDACWLDADGHIGMVKQAQQREEGVFFTQAAMYSSGDRKGQGCVPRCTVPVLFISLFFPPGLQSSWGRHSTKGLALSQVPKPGLQSGVCYLWQTVTQHISYLQQRQIQACSHCFSCIPAYTVRLCRGMTLLPNHTRNSPRDTPITTDTVAIFSYRYSLLPQEAQNACYFHA